MTSSKMNLRFLLTLSYFVSFIFCFSETKALNRIVIDPGHGGRDLGASYHSIQESKLTLKVAKKLKSSLAKQGYLVFMTRESDSHVSLTERVDMAHQFKGELFLSIHANSSHDSRAKGMEVFFENQLPADEESIFLANKENTLTPEELRGVKVKKDQILQDSQSDILSILYDLNRNIRIQKSSILSVELLKNWQGKKKSIENTIRQAPFYVISNVQMPSALIEMGFLSNQKEAKSLNSESYQDKIVAGILQAIETYKIESSKISDNTSFQ